MIFQCLLITRYAFNRNGYFREWLGIEPTSFFRVLTVGNKFKNLGRDILHNEICIQRTFTELFIHLKGYTKHFQCFVTILIMMRIKGLIFSFDKNNMKGTSSQEKDS